MAKETREVRGIKVSVDPRLFTDWDFVMKMSEAMGGFGGDEASVEDSIRGMRITDDLLTQALGAEQKAMVFDKIRENNDGFIPVQEVTLFLADLMAQGAETKKSSGSQDASPSTAKSS